MTTLVIETATAACSVALIVEGVERAAAHEVVGRGHAERLVPMIAAVMANGGEARASAILVDCGPGSFTGTRVGLAAARGLGLAWGVPVTGFSSLALLAAGANDIDDALTAAIGGGHGELFVQRFAGLAPLGDFRSLTPEAAGRWSADAWVVGPGAAALVAARGFGRVRETLPCAAHAPRLPTALTTLPPTPLYGRAPDATPKAA